jgi:uncharacterized protein (TIGR00290 family)
LASKKKIIFSWSGGKDSALALYEILQRNDYEILALLTTVTKDYDRISMHGVRRELLKQQVKSLGFPLEEVFVTVNASNDEYEANMGGLLSKYKELGTEAVIFGDIFLEDLRLYREQNLSKLDLYGIYPLWNINTTELANKFIDLGFKAITTCIDTSVLDGKFSGRLFDKTFLSELPQNIDSCGENGEFHSFVFDGPIFKTPIYFQKGKIVLRENRFSYCDLISRL